MILEVLKQRKVILSPYVAKFQSFPSNLLGRVDSETGNKCVSGKPITSHFIQSPEDLRLTDEVLTNTSFTTIMQKYPTVESSSATSQIWNFFKYLEKPNGKKNIICILCAKKGAVKLLTKSTASTNTLSQHLGGAHAELVSLIKVILSVLHLKPKLFHLNQEL